MKTASHEAIEEAAERETTREQINRFFAQGEQFIILEGECGEIFMERTPLFDYDH